MSVYFVVQEEITDAAGMEAYGKAAGPTLQGVRGEVLVVDDNVQAIEGDWHGSRLVVLKFEDDQAFHDWYDSSAYQEARKLRLASSDSRGALARGLG
ncbi:MAG TPA: DUF1330 domain-containing protein [Dehalococcoidia bacterium]|nr:DUF1330 domain-containing protein [Dehalococcoidia bacterium]